MTAPLNPQHVLTRWTGLTLEQRAAILDALPEKQQEVIEPLMEALLEGRTPNLAEIGRELGIDRSRVRRRLDVALRQIAAKL